MQPEALNTLSDCLACLQSMIRKHLCSASLSAKISERLYFMVHTKNSIFVRWLTGCDKILVTVIAHSRRVQQLKQTSFKRGKKKEGKKKKEWQVFSGSNKSWCEQIDPHFDFDLNKMKTLQGTFPFLVGMLSCRKWFNSCGSWFRREDFLKTQSSVENKLI